jgi:hypothetical protein
VDEVRPDEDLVQEAERDREIRVGWSPYHVSYDRRRRAARTE